MEQDLIAALKSGKAVRIPAKGLSMHPFLRPGDALTIVPRNAAGHSPRIGDAPDRVRIGDVVLFDSGAGRLLLHRVIGMKNSAGDRKWVITKGDALLSPDAPVGVEQVLGKLLSLTRSGSGREYRLAQAGMDFFGRIVACLSRLETSAGRWRGVLRRSNSTWLKKMIKAPRWLLTRVLMP